MLLVSNRLAKAQSISFGISIFKQSKRLKKMKKSLLALYMLVAVATKMMAQDEATFNHYLINPVLVNPAFTGNGDKFYVYGHYRTQWTGFANAPQTYAMSVNGPLADKVGIGAMLLSETYGLTNRLRGQLSYAYHYKNEKKGFQAGFGFSTEFHRTRLNNAVLTNGFYDGGDRLVEANLKNVSIFDATVGAYAILNNKITLHAASPNLIRARVGQIEDTSKSEKTFLRQFILGVGYKSVMSDKLTIEPSIQMRRVYRAPLEVEMNLMARFMQERFSVGGYFRPGSSGAMGLLVGVKESFFQLYYSYNASIAEFKTYSSQAHEITLGVTLNKPSKDKSPTGKKKKRYKN
jgi:type IX secretion system PorP/SprF family membrane protein